VGARTILAYVRGEYVRARESLAWALEEAASEGLLEGLAVEIAAGHGAYICGEETALLESLEGRRPEPRLRPPFPVESGFRGHPTLIHNVETIAAVPDLVLRGPARFRSLGRHGNAGTKLLSISGHVRCPGVYELPFGCSLDDLLHAAGGTTGELKAFAPGGASGGFLPARLSGLPLDAEHLGKVGAQLGSGGVVVLDQRVNMAWAADVQTAFFRDESCGQCAPCRIGTRVLAGWCDEGVAGRRAGQVAEIAWEMDEGSICGLGRAAPTPLVSALRWFPEDFEV
jgi:NADH:ubiquinone oxidoreductase subunit F (NADH-binding)